MFDSEKRVLLIFAALASMIHFTSFRRANFEIIDNEPTKFNQKKKNRSKGRQRSDRKYRHHKSPQKKLKLKANFLGWRAKEARDIAGL